MDPKKLEQQRQNEAALNKLKLEANNNVDINEIKNATPENLKAQGSAKLPFIIYTIGSQVKTIIQPSVNNLMKQYIEKYNTQGVCLTKVELDDLRHQRDLIVEQLNNIGIKIDKIGTSITGISFFLDTVLTLIITTEISSIALMVGSQFLPTVPGSIPAALNAAQTLIRKTIFDQYGNSKLSKYQTIINSSALVLSIVSSYILTVVEMLKNIDYVLKTCDPNNPLSSINPQIKSLADTQLKASQTQNQTTYQGFIIEIEEVPYTPTVNRRRALGRNSQGITLIQTELSFTTNNQTLINELKLIIDRDNLKAY